MTNNTNTPQQNRIMKNIINSLLLNGAKDAFDIKLLAKHKLVNAEAKLLKAQYDLREAQEEYDKA